VRRAWRTCQCEIADCACEWVSFAERRKEYVTFSDAISLGPVALSLGALVTLLSVAVGLGAISFVFRRHPMLRRKVVEPVLNSLVIFLVAWKLTPALAHLGNVLADPRLILYYPGGLTATVVGVVLAAIYLGVAFGRNYLPVLPALQAVGVGAAGALLVVLMAMGTVRTVTAIQISRAAERMNLPSSADGISGERLPVGLAPGFRAPDVLMKTLSGTQLHLGELQGRPVVLNFWATWCGPCRAELEVKKRIERELGGAVSVIGVNLTRTEAGPEAVKRYVDQHGVNYTVVLDEAGYLQSTFGVRGTPTTFIIGPDGTIRDKRFGAMSYSWLRGRLSELVKNSDSGNVSVQ